MLPRPLPVSCNMQSCSPDAAMAWSMYATLEIPPSSSTQYASIVRCHTLWASPRVILLSLLGSAPSLRSAPTLGQREHPAGAFELPSPRHLRVSLLRRFAFMTRLQLLQRLRPGSAASLQRLPRLQKRRQLKRLQLLRLPPPSAVLLVLRLEQLWVDSME